MRFYPRILAGSPFPALLLACAASVGTILANAAHAQAGLDNILSGQAAHPASQPPPAGGLDALLAGTRDEAEAGQRQRAEAERLRQELARAQAQAQEEARRAERELEAMREEQEREIRAMRRAAERASYNNDDDGPSTASVVIDSLNRAAGELRATQRSAQAGYERAMRDAQERQRQQQAQRQRERQEQLRQSQQQAEQRQRQLQQQIAQREAQARQQQDAAKRQLDARMAALAEQCRQGEGTWDANRQQCALPTSQVILGAGLPSGGLVPPGAAQAAQPAAAAPQARVAGLGAAATASSASGAPVPAASPAARQAPATVRLTESLAYCRSKGTTRTLNNREGWFCEGPTQKLWTSYDDLGEALRMVGCSRADYRERHHGYDEGLVFYCAEGLKPYDRDLARLLSLPSYVLVKRDIYTCEAAKAAGSAGCGRHSAVGVVRGAGY